MAGYRPHTCRLVKEVVEDLKDADTCEDRDSENPLQRFEHLPGPAASEAIEMRRISAGSFDCLEGLKSAVPGSPESKGGCGSWDSGSATWQGKISIPYLVFPSLAVPSKLFRTSW